MAHFNARARSRAISVAYLRVGVMHLSARLMSAFAEDDTMYGLGDEVEEVATSPPRSIFSNQAMVTSYTVLRSDGVHCARGRQGNRDSLLVVDPVAAIMMYTKEGKVWKPRSDSVMRVLTLSWT